jgi:hypothetical protein
MCSSYWKGWYNYIKFTSGFILLFLLLTSLKYMRPVGYNAFNLALSYFPDSDFFQSYAPN